MKSSQSPTELQSSRGERILSDVLWSWMGVVFNLVIGILLSPYIIRKLGAEGYGLWTLVFSVVGYYSLLDLGFRSAVVRYSAHYRAQGETEKINELINTALGYFTLLAVALLLASIYIAGFAGRYFQVSAAFQHDFSLLILIMGTSTALQLNLVVFGCCLEGFQRFDLSSRIWVASTGVRALGCLAALAMGYGLVALGLIALLSQLLGHALTFLSFRRIFPSLRFSLDLARLATLKQMLSYGIHTLVANISNSLLSFAAPVMIGHYLPVANVGYFNLPQRLLQYTGDLVSRVGGVTSPGAAELNAKGSIDSILRLGIYANRYCLTVFMPMVIIFLTYGREILTVWVGAAFAAQSAPLLPILLIGFTFAVAAQYNSSAILFGLAKHKVYAWGLLVEASVSVALMLFVIPRQGILGVAWVTAILMILVRGLFTPWLICRYLHFSFFIYMRDILARPLLTALPVFALVFSCKAALMPGKTLIQLAAIAVLVGGTYFGAAFYTCLFPQHRTMMLDWLRKRTINRFKKPTTNN